MDAETREKELADVLAQVSAGLLAPDKAYGIVLSLLDAQPVEQEPAGWVDADEMPLLQNGVAIFVSGKPLSCKKNVPLYLSPRPVAWEAVSRLLEAEAEELDSEGCATEAVHLGYAADWLRHAVKRDGLDAPRPSEVVEALREANEYVAWLASIGRVGDVDRWSSVQQKLSAILQKQEGNDE